MSNKKISDIQAAEVTVFQALAVAVAVQLDCLWDSAHRFALAFAAFGGINEEALAWYSPKETRGRQAHCTSPQARLGHAAPSVGTLRRYAYIVSCGITREVFSMYGASVGDTVAVDVCNLTQVTDKPQALALLAEAFHKVSKQGKKSVPQAQALTINAQGLLEMAAPIADMHQWNITLAWKYVRELVTNGTPLSEAIKQWQAAEAPKKEQGTDRPAQDSKKGKAGKAVLAERDALKVSLSETQAAHDSTGRKLQDITRELSDTRADLLAVLNTFGITVVNGTVTGPAPALAKVHLHTIKGHKPQGAPVAAPQAVAPKPRGKKAQGRARAANLNDRSKPLALGQAVEAPQAQAVAPVA